MFRDVAETVVRPGAAKRDQSHAFPYDLLPALAATGLFGAILPEEVGGDGLDTVSFALALEEIARVDQSVALTVANIVGLSGLPLYLFGSDEQRNKWLSPVMDGTVLGAFALTEPGGGSDTAAARTRATRTDGGWVLNGSKTFITNAGTDLTKFAITTAVTGKRDDGRSTISAFLVETDNPGYSVGPPLSKLGWRASDTREVFFRDCEVPDSALFGLEGQGLRQFLQTLEFGRIQIATLGVGLAQGALDAATEYAKTRTAFGKPIAQHQGVAFKIADSAVETESARLLTLRAAWLRDAGLPFGHAASMAKLAASEAAMHGAHRAVQIHGGYGFTDEYEVSRFFRDAKGLEIGEGTSEIQRAVIAAEITGLRSF
jgi:alkylation response protein AidB-like acyl-CoA dehydrogenase